MPKQHIALSWSMTIGWHRLARPWSVENMLIWWYHTLNWFIRNSVCKYFCPTHTRAGPSEAWIRSLQWPERSLLHWRTASVERILDELGDKKWEKAQNTANNWHICISVFCHKEGLLEKAISGNLPTMMLKSHINYLRKLYYIIVAFYSFFSVAVSNL